MDTKEYLFISIGFLVLTLICVVGFNIGLFKAVALSSLPERNKTRTRQWSVLISVMWLVFIALISLSGFTQDFSMPPRMGLAIFPPLIVSVFLIFSGRADPLLKQIPQTRLIGSHTFRIMVELLLFWLFVIELIPVQMTFEGYNWDILTGLTCIPVVFLLFWTQKLNKLVVVWNIVGLILLINIVAISILSSPVPFRLFWNEPANTIVTYFPIIYLPSVLVPFAYILHFLSLRKVYIESRADKS
jgi:hypothetical protein